MCHFYEIVNSNDVLCTYLYIYIYTSCMCACVGVYVCACKCMFHKWYGSFSIYLFFWGIISRNYQSVALFLSFQSFWKKEERNDSYLSLHTNACLCMWQTIYIMCMCVCVYVYLYVCVACVYVWQKKFNLIITIINWRKNWNWKL